MKIADNNTRLHPSTGASWHRSQRRAGFTLVEMMVTLAIMMLLFGIIFVPLNQAFNFFQLGQTRTNMQQAARQVLEQISGDLRTAVRVFPNDLTPGITNQAPYNNNAPYILEGESCSATNDPDPTVERPANLSRIDFIPANVDNQGSVITPVTPGKYLVTYYARRFDTTKDYEPVNNPVLLYRAQSPIRNNSGIFLDGGEPNVDTSSARYNPSTDPPPCTNRGSRWLYQSERNEPIGLADTATREPSDGSVAASHTRAIPLGVSLTAPLAIPPDNVTPPPPPNYTPLTTFTLTDANDDGKIDQVKINLALESHNTASTTNNEGKMPDAQKVRMSTTVDLPNVM